MDNATAGPSEWCLGFAGIDRNPVVILTRFLGLAQTPGTDACSHPGGGGRSAESFGVEPGSNLNAGQEASPDCSWLTSRRFALLLVVLVLVDYGAVILGWKSFFFRDFGYFGYPLAHYHRECFWRGELPLWNPLSCNGLPFLAQWNTLTLYPLSLIYLLLPLPWSLNLFCVAHLVLAGTGMFVLARHWTGNRLAAGGPDPLHRYVDGLHPPHDCRSPVRRHGYQIPGLILAEPERMRRGIARRGLKLGADTGCHRHLGQRQEQPAVGKVVRGGYQPIADQRPDHVAVLALLD